MEKPHTSVNKSKSSNSAIASKVDHRNQKKTSSNVEFRRQALKKRGVYVEKKSTKTSINDAENIPKKPLPRARSGKKGFLGSVLTPLSKTTDATQQTNNLNSGSVDKYQPKPARKKIQNFEIKKDTDKKKKFRSRVLNENNINKEQFVILQSKRDIVQTPSIYSETSRQDFKWSDLPRLVKNESVDKVAANEQNKIYKSIVEGINSDGKKKRVKILEQDPSTLVAEEPRKDDTKLYSFFVDLLETTFNVYKVKPEYEAPSVVNEVSSTKISMEIDESVAEKLDVTKERTEVTDDESPKKADNLYFIQHESDWNNNHSSKSFDPLPDKKLEHKSGQKTKRKLKTKSFVLPKTTVATPESRSFTLKQKKGSPRHKNRNKKKELLDSLKEQLRMDNVAYEEPRSLYQALRVIARNKRRCQNSIRFEAKHKRLPKSADGFDPECMFKRKKLISPKKKHKRGSEFQLAAVTDKYSDATSVVLRKPEAGLVADDVDSWHSLEVYGFDYDASTGIKSPNRDKGIVLTYHSSPSYSDNDFNPNETILSYADSGTSTITNDNGFHSFRNQLV